jgi:hypothetical protein
MDKNLVHAVGVLCVRCRVDVWTDRGLIFVIT